MKTTLRNSVAAMALMALASPQAAALTIETSNDAFGLANTLFLNIGVQPNSAFLTTGALETGAEEFQTGIYTNLAGTYGLPNRGIVMSSGDVNEFASAPPPDDDEFNFGSTGFNAAASEAQNALLSPITGQSNHNDVAQLDIQFFSPNAANLTFFATFGSMEWPEFVGDSFIDGFGLYVNGQNVAGATPTGGGAPQAININHPDMQAIPGTILNGVLAPNGNPVLEFEVPILAGLNDFTVIVADASDDVEDTTVFLSSFFAEPGSGGGGGGDGGPVPPVGPTGESEFDPFLPSNPPDPETGEFIIALPEAGDPGEILWFDPPATIGFDYAVDGNAFDSLLAPSLATVPDLDGYFITVDGVTVALAPASGFDFFDVFGVNPTAFTLTGIDPSLGLDPLDPLAFPLGLAFVDPTSSLQSLSLTPIVDGGGDGGGDMQVIPLPPALALFGSALAMLGAAGARRTRRTA